MNKLATYVFTFFLAGLLLVFTDAALWAQDKKSDASLHGAAFDRQSLALRTALHYDPSLDAPLKSLIRLYEKAGRLDDLLALYRAHTSQYGDDVGAKVVMVRLLKKMERVEAGEMVQSAAKQYPEHAGLKYLLYQDYKKRGDPRALKTLSEAIDRQQVAGRRQAWMEELLSQAQEADARVLADKHLREILLVPEHTAESLMSLAKQMHRYHFEELCLEALSKAQTKNPDAETGVEIDLLAARAEAALGRFDVLTKRMDVLLKRLAPDYHRRREIMKLRVSLVKNDADRSKLLEQARLRYEKEPLNEGAVLDYVELLSANEMRRKAVLVAIAGAESLPKSESLEKEALSLLDRIGDEQGMLKFLQQRLKVEPAREDLQYRLVKLEYLVGKDESARKRLEVIIKNLGKEERARRLLDLARYLRQMSQPREAANLLTEVTDLLPARLDVKRELLETLLALKQRSKAGELLATLSIEDAEIENFIDLLQFMLQADFLLEARVALEARLKKEGENLDLNLLLVSVLGKTGDRKKADEILMQSRKAADTSARYAQWLESGIELYELLERPEQFFDAEQFRFLDEGKDWTADRVDRFLTLCELGERKQLGDRVAQALRNQLAETSLPDSLKLRLRLLLVKALDKSPDNAGEVEQLLELLAKEDVKRADSYQLRRALLYHSNSRPDLARDLLQSIDMEKVEDEAILRAAYLVFLEYSLIESAKICLKKMTELEPAETGGWEKRLSLLAALGEEEELRLVLRRLLEGADKMMLDVKSRQALRIYLLDSYWRSLSQLVEKGGTETLGEALVMLDSVDREAGQARDRGWSLWARAYILNRLERQAARDEVVKELASFLRSDENENGQAMITFPDGLAISVEEATRLLKTKTVKGQAALMEFEDSEGPLGDLEMAWAFESDPGARILQVEAAGEKNVLVLDDQGTVYNVDARSGKVLWFEQYRRSVVPNQLLSLRSPLAAGTGGITISNSQFRVRQQGKRIMVQQLSAPYGSVGLGPKTGGVARGSSFYFAPGVKEVNSILLDGAERFFLTQANQIKCFRTSDASLLWQSDLDTRDDVGIGAVMGMPSISRPDPELFLDGDHLLCYDPDSDVALCFEKQTGKLVWSRDLGAESSVKGMVYSLNSGADSSAGRLFVFGRTCEILDASSGKTIWSFDDVGAHRFPVSLDRVREDAEQDEAAKSEKTAVSPAPLAFAAGGSVAPPPTTFLDHKQHGDDVVGRMEQLKPFLQGEGALVAPAVQWNSLRGLGRGGADAKIVGDRLLLMGVQGLQEISLTLPIGSNRFDVHGILIGVAGDKVWFLNGSVLSQISLSDRRELQVDLGVHTEGENPVHAVMSGSRIYVSQDRGLTVLNAYNGRVISDSAWPGMMQDYLTKQGEASDAQGMSEGQKVAAWQGHVRNIPGRPVYCFPLRDRVRGDRLFTMVNDSSFVMLRAREVVAPKK